MLPQVLISERRGLVETALAGCGLAHLLSYFVFAYVKESIHRHVRQRYDSNRPPRIDRKVGSFKSLLCQLDPGPTLLRQGNPRETKVTKWFIFLCGCRGIHNSHRSINTDRALVCSDHCTEDADERKTAIDEAPPAYLVQHLRYITWKATVRDWRTSETGVRGHYHVLHSAFAKEESKKFLWRFHDTSFKEGKNEVPCSI